MACARAARARRAGASEPRSLAASRFRPRGVDPVQREKTSLPFLAEGKEPWRRPAWCSVDVRRPQATPHIPEGPSPLCPGVRG
eukprot:scaffold60_cov325-Pavlova_lutheri.AAC.21